jgi:hypothetical protein
MTRIARHQHTDHNPECPLACLHALKVRYLHTAIFIGVLMSSALHQDKMAGQMSPTGVLSGQWSHHVMLAKHFAVGQDRLVIGTDIARRILGSQHLIVIDGSLDPNQLCHVIRLIREIHVQHDLRVTLEKNDIVVSVSHVTLGQSMLLVLHHRMLILETASASHREGPVPLFGSTQCHWLLLLA